MDMLRADLAHHGEIQSLWDANASLTTAQNNLQTTLHELQETHKMTTEGNALTIASLQAEVTALQGTSNEQKRLLHELEEICDENPSDPEAPDADLRTVFSLRAQVTTLEDELRGQELRWQVMQQQATDNQEAIHARANNELQRLQREHEENVALIRSL